MMPLPFPVLLLPAERLDPARAQQFGVEHICRGAHTNQDSLDEAVVMAGWWTRYLVELARVRP